MLATTLWPGKGWGWWHGGIPISPPPPPPPSPPGPPPPPATGDFVVVQRGASQAVIQVVKPLATNFMVQVSGGGTTQYPLDGSGFDYWMNGAQNPWNGGLPVAQAADIANRHTIDVTNLQWHIVFQATPAQAAGELVTIIEVGAWGDAYAPKTLADVQALAPQLFV